MKEKNKKIVLYIIIGIVVVACIGGVSALLLNNKQSDTPSGEKADGNKGEEKNENSYIEILEGKKVLRSDLKITDNAKVNSSKTDKKSGMIFLDVVEPDFQFETHYLFCFDKDGKLVFEVRDLNDKDNDDNRYKFNGKFAYDENKKVLTFNTNLFLGESDEATGKAFNDKGLSELTSDEKKVLGNYSDEVKYTYKYENKKFSFAEKKEISKLKDNAYYKNVL